jgi:hypothetical protein
MQIPAAKVAHIFRRRLSFLHCFAPQGSQILLKNSSDRSVSDVDQKTTLFPTGIRQWENASADCHWQHILEVAIVNRH